MKSLEQLKKLRAEMDDPQMQAAMDKKIAKMEAQMSAPQETEVVEEEVVVETPVKKERKPRAPRKPRAEKPAPTAKESRHVFEKKVEGGKEVKVVKATSPEQAKEAMKGSGFEYVREIKRGRAPKEGFIGAAKPKRVKAKAKPARASKASREAMAKSSGASAEKSEKVAKAVKTAKKRGRKPLDKKAFLFEKEMKTQMGKKKVKIVKAVSEEAARKSAGSSFKFVRELKAGEKPKTGLQPIEGFVPPFTKEATERANKRGEKMMAERKAQRAAKRVPAKKVEEQAEAIGEGIGIANRNMEAELEDVYQMLDSLNAEIGVLQQKVATISGEVVKIMNS